MPAAHAATRGDGTYFQMPTGSGAAVGAGSPGATGAGAMVAMSSRGDGGAAAGVRARTMQRGRDGGRRAGGRALCGAVVDVGAGRKQARLADGRCKRNVKSE